MRKLSLLFFLFISFANTGSAKRPFTGFDIQHHTITRELQVAVFLPDHYNPRLSYPVLYFNDGQGLEAGLYLDIEELGGLIKKGEIVPLILVAIYTTGHRSEQYNPYMDSTMVEQNGSYNPQGERYSRQLIKVLLPFIEKKYAIDKERRGMVGISLGGLQAGWMALKHPGIFSFIGAVSPAFWVKDYALLKEEVSDEIQSTRFYFDIGTGEWNYYLPFIKSLEKAGLAYGKDLFYREIPDARHVNEDWKDRMTSIVRLFLLKDPGPPQRWTIEVECIPSRSRPGHYFQRINPVVFLDGDIPYSLAFSAEYSIVKGEGRVETDGRYEITKGNAMTVEVKKGEWSKKVKVKTCK